MQKVHKFCKTYYSYNSKNSAADKLKKLQYFKKIDSSSLRNIASTYSGKKIIMKVSQIIGIIEDINAICKKIHFNAVRKLTLYISGRFYFHKQLTKMTRPIGKYNLTKLILKADWAGYRTLWGLFQGFIRYQTKLSIFLLKIGKDDSCCKIISQQSNLYFQNRVLKKMTLTDCLLERILEKSTLNLKIVNLIFKHHEYENMSLSKIFPYAETLSISFYNQINSDSTSNIIGDFENIPQLKRLAIYLKSSFCMNSQEYSMNHQTVALKQIEHFMISINIDETNKIFFQFLYESLPLNLKTLTIELNIESSLESFPNFIQRKKFQNLEFKILILNTLEYFPLHYQEFLIENMAVNDLKGFSFGSSCYSKSIKEFDLKLYLHHILYQNNLESFNIYLCNGCMNNEKLIHLLDVLSKKTSLQKLKLKFNIFLDEKTIHDIGNTFSKLKRLKKFVIYLCDPEDILFNSLIEYYFSLNFRKNSLFRVEILNYYSIENMCP